MRRTLRVLLLLLPAIVLAGPIATIAWAQDEPAASAPDASVDEKVELADEGTRLLETLRLVHERIGSLEVRLADATGADRQIVSRQTADAKLEYIEILHKLVTNLTAQENLGADAPGVRSKVEADLRRLPGAVESHLDDAIDELGVIHRVGDGAEAAHRDPDQPDLRIALAERSDHVFVQPVDHGEFPVVPEVGIAGDDVEAGGRPAGGGDEAELVEMFRAVRKAGQEDHQTGRRGG